MATSDPKMKGQFSYETLRKLEKKINHKRLKEFFSHLKKHILYQRSRNNIENLLELLFISHALLYF